MPTPWLSHHARIRASQRGLTPDEIGFVLTFGRKVRRTGVCFVFLGERDVPARHRLAKSHLVGTTVLMSVQGIVLTVYKNKDALKTIKRKKKGRAAGERVRQKEFAA